jgi:hypothetical protein
MELNIEDIPENENIQTNRRLTYDDIMNKMGIFSKDGKLYQLLPQTQTQNQVKQTQSQVNHKNSYIYNKYFNNQEQQQQPEIRVPKSIQEYKMMLVQSYIEREKIRRIKSTKLIMSNSNINISNRNNANLNRLFALK